MPAMNEPIAMDKPACSVSQAKPSVMSKIFSMKSSSLLRRSTIRSHTRMAFCPPHSNKPTNTAALSKAEDNSTHTLPSFIWPNAGISTSKGTTAKSWNSNTPMTRRPCSLSSSSRSAIIFTTIAVLDMAIAPANTSEPCQDNSQGRLVKEKAHVKR